MNDRIEKQIELKAPLSRVWNAITNAKDFSTWFGADIDSPFAIGHTSRGQVKIKNYEHMTIHAHVTALEPETYFAFTWHPYPIDPNVDYLQEPPTLVEFRLEPTATGTLLKVTESGFEKLSEARRAEAYRSNEGGWVGQLKNIEKYLAA